MNIFHHPNNLFPSYFNQNLSNNNIRDSGGSCYHNDTASTHSWPSPSNYPLTGNQSLAGSQFTYNQLPSSYPPMDRSPLGQQSGYMVEQAAAECPRDATNTYASDSPSTQYTSPGTDIDWSNTELRRKGVAEQTKSLTGGYR